MKWDNYQLQAAQAKKLFLSYDQQELISRCHLAFDDSYFYIAFLGSNYRICRKTGDMQRCKQGAWIDGNSFGEVMTILDWLCDSKDRRIPSGKWINPVSQGTYFHRSLQEDSLDRDAVYFDRNPDGFICACRKLKGEAVPGGDISFAVELLDGLRICIQLWHGDSEFAPRLCFLWDENYGQYLRYETTWYAIGVLRERLRENERVI